MEREGQAGFESADIMIYGVRPVQEALEAGKNIDKVFLQRGLGGPEAKALMRGLKEAGIPMSEVPPEKLSRLTKKNHQGVIAFMSRIDYVPLENAVALAYESGRPPLIIVLDRVTDVRNMGAIARTAECAGAHALVVPASGSALINAEAMKASAGALNHLPVCRVKDLAKALEYLNDSGLTSVACTEKADKIIHSIEMEGPVALVLGSEDDGISPHIMRRCAIHAKLPMLGHTASLNVSVAAGAFIFEVLRQRNIT